MRLVGERQLRPIRLTEKGVAPDGPLRPAVAPKSPAKSKESGKDFLKDARTASAPAAAQKRSFGSANAITPRILENFTRLLSSLLAAGVPLSRALVILIKEAATPAAAEKWKRIHALVVDGLSLTEAMARSPETFPRVYVAMVEAGEAGGSWMLCWRRSPIFRRVRKR